MSSSSNITVRIDDSDIGLIDYINGPDSPSDDWSHDAVDADVFNNTVSTVSGPASITFNFTGKSEYASYFSGLFISV